MTGQHGGAPRRARTLPFARHSLTSLLEAEAGARSGFAIWPISIGFGIAAFFAGYLVLPLGLTLPLSIAAIGALLLAQLRGVPGAAAVTLTGLLIGQAATGLELHRTHTTILSGNVTTRIEGRVLSRETDERGRQRYVVDLLATSRPTLSRPPERVRILVAARHDPIPIGSTLEALVRLRPPAGPAYPGSHDFSFAPFFDGLGAYGFSLGAPTRGTDTRLGFFDHVSRLRLLMGERIRSVLNGPEGAVASALITGERAGVPQDIEDDLRATSLAHILSISGFHMALVAGFSMLAIRSLLACAPTIALRFPIRKWAAVAALGATTFYMLLRGDNAATERSFIMIALMLGAVVLDRPSLTLRNVGFAALIVMLLSPHVVLTATFQMSFAATAALVGAFGTYARWRTAVDRATGREERNVARSVALALAAAALSSLIAGAATAPYGVYQFQRIAPFGLVANVLATPLFSFWVMPLALVSAIAMPFGLDAVPLRLMGWGLQAAFALARTLAEWLPDQATGRISAASVLLFTASILALSFFATALRWICVPLAACAFLVMRSPASPEAILFEDGTQLALLGSDGRATYLPGKEDRFVRDQWERVYPQSDKALPSAFACADGVCRTETRSGIRIAWTDDWKRWPDICAEADVAIVARAIRETACPNGTPLATLRTLRATGSLGIEREHGTVALRPSVVPNTQPWNRHRFAAWPEFWRRPVVQTDAAAGLSGTGGSTRQVDPAP